MAVAAREAQKEVQVLRSPAKGCAPQFPRLSYFTIAEDLPANSSTQVGKMLRKRVPSAGRTALRRLLLPPEAGFSHQFFERAYRVAFFDLLLALPELVEFATGDLFTEPR
jgi:hypothetical protein